MKRLLIFDIIYLSEKVIRKGEGLIKICNKDYNDLKDLVILSKEMNEKQLEIVSELVDDTIRYKIVDENEIGHVFDKMLSIEFIEEEDIKKIYYKLLNYTKKINEELFNDYEKFFVEKFSDIEEIELLVENDFVIRKQQLDNYYEIGKNANNYIQQNNKKSLVRCLEEYMKNLDNKYTIDEVKQFIKFYKLISIGIDICYEITWDDYKELLLLENEYLINFYLNEIKIGRHSINNIRNEWRKEGKYKIKQNN